MIPARTLALAPLLALAACGSGDQASSSGDDAAAKGEVREGTASDAMLPFDRIESQSPPVKTAPSAGAKPGGSDSDDEGSDEEAGEAGTAAEPAEPAEAAEPSDEG